MASELELDLIEISPKAEPPICRIADFQKFLYQLKKKQKDQKSKATKVVVKEIRFGPNTDDHDYNFKLNHAKKFLQDGSKVKAYVFFKGRTILFKDKGEILLYRFAQDLEEYAKVEQMPKLEGKRMIMMFSSKITPKGVAPKGGTSSNKAILKKESQMKEAAEKAAAKKEASKKAAVERAAAKKDAPKIDAPKTDAPKTDAPKNEALSNEVPKIDVPKNEAPNTDAPKNDAPKKD